MGLSPPDNQRLAPELMTLLLGGAVCKVLPQFISLPELTRDPDALRSFLLMAGYLRRDGVAAAANAPQALRIPNQEVALGYQESFLLWLEEGAGNSGEEVQRWCQALVRGEQEFAEAGLRELFRNVLSFQPALWTRWTCFLAQERTDAGLRELEYAAACPALAQIRPEHAPEPENKALLSQVQVAHYRSP